MRAILKKYVPTMPHRCFQDVIIDTVADCFMSTGKSDIYEAAVELSYCSREIDNFLSNERCERGAEYSDNTFVSCYRLSDALHIADWRDYDEKAIAGFRFVARNAIEDTIQAVLRD